ncbi:hypothetical protein SAMN05216257_102376 [Meinhardsimonia xiamenensis]|jgi:hypothetical protein|uniref:Divergent polysaccharide deacetylase n=1 Tax=Meinhardsimonia xiamenensis TaxID=990712 RepID=A0A1G9B2A1_9RHOB|nr:divergent polysaccharide deacteylase family protein [Meinhardsimonia xiamenensis]PRX35148.1 hypothetical protein LV81_01743 [Meinhardsimonia xiamenensis]SDK33716.1 hypothetical protein SAMN05216257_102376 [Meinhardsimonia xiamenensis]
MGRGFLSGLIWGTLVSLAVLATVSWLAQQMARPPAPDAEAGKAPPGSEFARPPAETDPAVPAPEAPPEVPQAARPAPPEETDETLAPPRADTAPAVAPQPEAEPPAPVAPPEAAAAEDPPELAARGLEDTPGGVAPQIAPPETDVPPVSLPAAPSRPETATASAPTMVPGSGEEAGATSGAEPGEGQAPVPTAAPAPPPAAPAELERGDAAPRDSAGEAMPERPQAAGEPAAPRPPAAAEATPTAPAGEAQGDRVEVADEIGPIRLPVPEAELGVPRLPGRADAPAAEDEAQPARPALEAHAAPFEWDGVTPLMSVVLIDREGAFNPAQIASLPFPVSVALDPTSEGAAAAMAAYRAAGVEVLVLAPLPEEASPADVEVAFEGFFTALPETVAVLDSEDAALQASRPRAVQVVDILARDGRGLVTWERGLNTALQVARQKDLPAATVFRAFDDGKRDVAAMKRFLDQAAFRARQEGAVIVVGHARPETLTALVEWALGNRAASLALAPVSAVLRAGAGG